MGIQAAEISAILKEQIKNFGQDAQVAEIGRVLELERELQTKGCRSDSYLEERERKSGVTCRDAVMVMSTTGP